MRCRNSLTSQWRASPKAGAAGDAAWVRYRRPCRRRGCSSDGGRGSCGPALAHRGAWVGVTGGDLHVAQVNPGVETNWHRCDEGMAKHVWMRLGCPYTGRFGEPSQAPGGRVPVHRGAAAVEQDRPVSAGAGCLVDGPAGGWRQRSQDDFGAFPANAQHPVAVLFAEVGQCWRRWPRRSAGRAARAWLRGRSRMGSVTPGRQ